MTDKDLKRLRRDELLEILIAQSKKMDQMQAELNAAGLEKVGHPMLVSILQSADEDPEGQFHAQRELADLLHVSPAAVANSLKCLERDGYVRREPWQRDARRNRVSLTDKGRRAVEKCGESFRAVDERMLSGFSPEEKEQLTGFFTRMIDNLGGVEPPPFCPPEKEGEDRC